MSGMHETIGDALFAMGFRKTVYIDTNDIRRRLYAPFDPTKLDYEGRYGHHPAAAKGNIVGERYSPDPVTDWVRRPHNPWGLKNHESYVVTKRDGSDLKMVAVGNLAAYDALLPRVSAWPEEPTDPPVDPPDEPTDPEEPPIEPPIEPPPPEPPLADAHHLLLADRFRVSVFWAGGGEEHAARAVPLTVTSGYFWFFRDDNVEIVAKVVDGRTVNDHWWFFYGALTDVGFTLRVEDTETGEVRTYESEQGTMASRGDAAAFRDPIEESDGG